MRGGATVVVGVLVAVMGGPAAADPPSPPSPPSGDAPASDPAQAGAALVPLQVDVQIDGEPRGDAIVFIDDQHTWIPEELLCEARVCVPGGLVREGVRYADLRTLGKLLHFKLDENTGELAIRLFPDELPTTTLQLGNRAPTGIEYTTAPSLFVNYAATAGYHIGSAAGIAERTELTGLGEAGFAMRNALAYSSVSATTDGVVRGLSSLSYDRRDQLLHVALGDEVVTGGVLGGSGVVGGAHASRDFSLDPYFVAQPTLSQSGVVATPSTVEIYRDGQLVRREVIPAGPFRIQDIVGATGANSQIVIKNPLGLQQMIVTPMVMPQAGALAPGLSQYNYAVGFVRDELAVSSFSYGAPAALAVYRRGIAPMLTLGGRLEATSDRGSAGASLLASVGRLGVEATAALSAAQTGASPAVALGLGWRERRSMVSALIRVVGQHYATIDLGPHDDRATAEADLTAAVLPTQRSSLSAQLGFEAHALTPSRARASLSGGVQLGEVRVTLSAGAIVTEGGGRPDLSASLSLTRALGARTIASTGINHDSTGDAVSASLAHAVLGNRGIGYDASARIGPIATVNSRVVAEHGYGRAELFGDWFGDTGRVAVSAAGGVVAIGGTVAPTRPIQGGFALIRVPGASGVRSYLDNRLIGTTDSRGNLVVPDLQPFYGNHVRIDVRDLPLDLPTDELEHLVAPPRRGGTIVSFAAENTATVAGTAVAARNGQLVDVSFAEVVVDGALRAPVGKDGAFEVEAVSVGHHVAAIDIEGQRCVFEIVVAEAPGRVELGHVACRFGRGMAMR